jgi:hypothetical protein
MSGDEDAVDFTSIPLRTGQRQYDGLCEAPPAPGALTHILLGSISKLVIKSVVIGKIWFHQMRCESASNRLRSLRSTAAAQQRNEFTAVTIIEFHGKSQGYMPTTVAQRAVSKQVHVHAQLQRNHTLSEPSSQL